MHEPHISKNGDVRTSLNMQFSDGLELNAYEQRRQELLTRESSNAWDSAAKQTASDVEVRAAWVLQHLRSKEEETLYGSIASERVPDADARESGGKTLVNFDRIEKSDVFRIIKHMPKGANLHLHFNAALDPVPFVEMARSMPTMFVRSTNPILSFADAEAAEVVFRVMPAERESADIFAPGYSPSTTSDGSSPWMLWSLFRKGFRERMDRDADDYILRKIMMTSDEIYNQNQTANGVWARFNQSTRCIKGLINYESAYRLHIRKLLESFVQDKIMYAELRPMLLDKWIPTDDGRTELGHGDQMRMILEETDRARRDISIKDFPFGFKVIYSTPRSVTRAVMSAELADCISLKRAYPDLICGFDLVGAEDRPNSIHFYAEELLAFRQECDRLGLDIPFLFHAGETLLDCGGAQSPRESNLYDAVLLHSKRVGHGYAVLKHPQLLELMRARGVCVEVCPISNEVLHLCGNAKQNVLPLMLAQGLECCICSDNQSMFKTTLSHDFYQVFVADRTMTLHGLRQLVEWSVKHSCLDAAEQEEARRLLMRDWSAFCQWVVDTFADVLVS